MWLKNKNWDKITVAKFSFYEREKYFEEKLIE